MCSYQHLAFLVWISPMIYCRSPWTDKKNGNHGWTAHTKTPGTTNVASAHEGIGSSNPSLVEEEFIMVQDLVRHPNQKQARPQAEMTVPDQISSNTGRITIPYRGRVIGDATDMMTETCMALIPQVPLNHCTKALVPCHAGDVGAHCNPPTTFIELQSMTDDIFSNDSPSISIYGAATGRSMGRITDTELLIHSGHMLSPKIIHEVIFGCSSFWKEQQISPRRLIVNFNFENCMDYNQECLVSNPGLKKNHSAEQQKVFYLDRYDICSDQQQLVLVSGMILSDNCTQEHELCLIPAMEKMLLECLFGRENLRMERLLTPIKLLCHNTRRENWRNL